MEMTCRDDFFTRSIKFEPVAAVRILAATNVMALQKIFSQKCVLLTVN